MAKEELTFPDLNEWAEKAAIGRQKDLNSQLKEQLHRTVVPYNVHLATQTFYFGPAEPTEHDWEIRGEWVETVNGPAIRRFELVASARVFVNGRATLRPADSVPGTGADRDLLRKYGSKPKIRDAIRRAKETLEADLLSRAASEAEIPDWGSDIIRDNKESRGSLVAHGKPFEWWVELADKYLAVAQKLGGTKYGVQAQLADKKTDEYWGVPIHGTRYRVRRLRETELIDDNGPIPRLGKNHPRMKEDR